MNVQKRFVSLTRARRVIRKMRGCSQSVLMECEDGNFYVVKMSGCPPGKNVLANEFVGAILLRAVGLPTADIAYVEVPDYLFTGCSQLYFETTHGRSSPFSGCYFGSRLVGGLKGSERPLDFLRASEADRVCNRAAFLGMLIFDTWANHSDDRQAVFTRNDDGCLLKGFFIDNGHLFGGPEWDYSKENLVSRHFEHSIYHDLWNKKSVGAWICLLQELIPSHLTTILPQVPRNWYDGDIHSLLHTLQGRLKRLPELIDARACECEDMFRNVASYESLRIQDTYLRGS